MIQINHTNVTASRDSGVAVHDAAGSWIATPPSEARDDFKLYFML